MYKAILWLVGSGNFSLSCDELARVARSVERTINDKNLIALIYKTIIDKIDFLDTAWIRLILRALRVTDYNQGIIDSFIFFVKKQKIKHLAFVLEELIYCASNDERKRCSQIVNALFEQFLQKNKNFFALIEFIEKNLEYFVDNSFIQKVFLRAETLACNAAMYKIVCIEILEKNWR